MSSKLIAAVWMALWPMIGQCQPLEAVYTSTRSVTGIVSTVDGTVVVGTRGGVLTRAGDASWCKYTMLDGLPDNEVLGVYLKDGNVIARCNKASAKLTEGRWIVATDRASPSQMITGQICSARWKGKDFVSTAKGLSVQVDNRWKPVRPPKSTGTHISALLDKGDALWAAMFDDGIYSWNGSEWKPIKIALPEKARGVTAMLWTGDRLWIGTIRDGVWDYHDTHWTQHLQPNEPWDHNCQALAWYHGDLYMSTLDEGLLAYGPGGWRHIGKSDLSADTPRQMVEFNNQLYLRQSIGIIDRFDGKAWVKNALPNLPRKQCSALASDGNRLYVGQWGGWSEFDGHSWTHHLDMPQLQGCQVTALLPDDQGLWIGTQGFGLAYAERASGAIMWHNELSGMPDDTIKCIARTADTIYAGTFARGLAWLAHDSKHWIVAQKVANEQVTDLDLDTSGGVYVATRNGLWHLTADRQMLPVIQGAEVQALQLAGNNLWAGTRTGLMRLVVSHPAQ